MENISIRCSNCGKSTGIYTKNMNTNYNDIITKFVLNKILYHIGMSWIVEKNHESKYDIEKHNLDWIIGGPWCNISIKFFLHGTVFESYMRNKRTDRYKPLCLLMHMRNRSHNLSMTVAVVVVMHYHQMQQQ